MHDRLLDGQVVLAREVQQLADQVRLLAQLQGEAVRSSTAEVRALSAGLKALMPRKVEDDGLPDRPDYVG